MANDVVLSAASRSNLLSLQSTQKSIDATQLRLATGKKVNSALDNPQSFFQSQSLTNRASDLTRLLDGIGQSIRTIQEADKGITALSTLVSQAESIASEAQAEILSAQGFVSLKGTTDLRGINLTTGSNGSIAATNTFTITVKDPDILAGVAQTGTITISANDTVDNVVANINANATINKYVRASVDSSGQLRVTSLEEGAAVRIADGAAANSLGADGFAFLGLDDVVTQENLNAVAAGRQGGTLISGRTLTSNAALVAIKGPDGDYQASATLIAAGYTSAADTLKPVITIDGTSSATPTLAATATIQDLVDFVNNDTSINSKVTASFDVKTGQIKLAFADTVGKAEIAFGGAATDVTTLGFGTGASDGTKTGVADLNSEAFVFGGSSVNLDQYTKDYNKVRSQIDSIVQDANYRGVNLLGGDKLTSYFNEDRSSTLVTEGQDLTVSGLGLAKANFIDAKSVELSLGQVRSALETVRAFGSSIANDLSIIQTRQNFTSETINTLKAGAADLVNADLNEEGANLLALQTAQQLGVTSLSLASQSQQAVLRLF